MRFRVTVILAGMAVFAGCQGAPDDETVTAQAVGGDLCQGKIAEPTSWDGSWVKPAGEGLIWVSWPYAYGQPNATGGKDWMFALVDTTNANALTTYFVADAQYDKFLYRVGRGRVVGPGYPPPEPCEIPLACGRMMVAYGMMVDQAGYTAPEQARACDGK